LAQLSPTGPLAESKNRLDLIQIESGPGPIDERLKHLVHGGAGLELQVAAVLDLVDRILIVKSSPLLFL